MSYFTHEEFHTVVKTAAELVALHTPNANADNLAKCMITVDIYRALVKLFVKVSQKREPVISEGKICRCIAKQIPPGQHTDLFTSCFVKFPNFNPNINDYSPLD